ncbi:hypothetical protein OSTOST_16640 [Ostertagia ostertagi]
MTWLGHIIDLREMSLDITQERKDKACLGINVLLKTRSPSLRQRLRVFGFLASMYLVIPRDKSKRKRSLITEIAEKASAGHSITYRWSLKRDEREELIEWLDYIRNSKTQLRSLNEEFRDFFIISTDASEYGVGAVFHSSHGKNSISTRDLPIDLRRASSTARELFGILHAIRAFSSMISGERVQIQTDSQTAQTVFYKGSTKRDLQRLALQIWETAERLRIRMEVFWIPRELNREADMVSRIVDLDGWSILDSIYEKLCELWGPFEADMFANAENRKCETFVSRWFSEGCAAVDAFSDSAAKLWSQCRCWDNRGLFFHKKTIPGFRNNLNIDKSHLGKIRNLFLAHLINENQLKALPLAVAALNFFYGHLERGEAELQKLLIDSAKKQTPAVRHKEKATDEDIDRVVNWALNIDTPKTIEDSCIILLSFLAFLRISETAAVRKEHLERKSTDVWWLLIPKSKTDQIKRAMEVLKLNDVLFGANADIREHEHQWNACGYAPTKRFMDLNRRNSCPPFSIVMYYCFQILSLC